MRQDRDPIEDLCLGLVLWAVLALALCGCCGCRPAAAGDDEVRKVDALAAAAAARIVVAEDDATSWDEIVDSEQLLELQHDAWDGELAKTDDANWGVEEQPKAESGKPEGIVYETEAEAKRRAGVDGRPLWYHVTFSRGCPHCVVVDGWRKTPMVVAASRECHCVLVVDPPLDHPWMRHWKFAGAPGDLIVSADGSAHRRLCGRAADVGSYLIWIEAARKYCAMTPGD